MYHTAGTYWVLYIHYPTCSSQQHFEVDIIHCAGEKAKAQSYSNVPKAIQFLRTCTGIWIQAYVLSIVHPTVPYCLKWRAHQRLSQIRKTHLGNQGENGVSCPRMSIAGVRTTCHWIRVVCPSLNRIRYLPLHFCKTAGLATLYCTHRVASGICLALGME